LDTCTTKVCGGYRRGATYRGQGSQSDWLAFSLGRNKQGPCYHRKAMGRGSHSRLVIERLRRALYNLAPGYRPLSLMRQAIDHLLNQWAALTAFLDYGDAEVSNNWVENTIRPSAVGKRNWLFIGDLEAGHRSVVIYSMAQTCQRRNARD
jgi:transposase